MEIRKGPGEKARLGKRPQALWSDGTSFYFVNFLEKLF
jgi:hypothetical protein